MGKVDLNWNSVLHYSSPVTVDSRGLLLSVGLKKKLNLRAFLCKSHSCALITKPVTRRLENNVIMPIAQLKRNLSSNMKFLRSMTRTRGETR